MKHYIVLFCILCVSLTSAQQKNNNKKAILKSPATNDSSDKWTEGSSIVAYHTPKMDTLFLNNDAVGKLIHRVWLMDKEYNGSNPIIVFVNDVEALKRKRQHNSKTTKN